MAFKLIIVESPTKAKTLQKYLGKKYTIEATMGHLVDLPKSKLGVEVENNFNPCYITIRGKGKILANLKKKAKMSSEVLLATDPDREGEAISWHLSRALDIEDKKCRIAFNEITKEAVLQAIKEPRLVNLNLVNAQQARRILDRLVGYQISPILWRKVRKGLSAGRVQTVAVRLICEREKEIEAFIPEEFWTIEGTFNCAHGKIDAQLNKIDGKKAKIKDKEEATLHHKGIKKESFVIQEIRQRQRKRNPSPPFTTSTLQQEAVRILGYSTRKTMVVAQQLYEGINLGKKGLMGLITYMRTDSVRISENAQMSAAKYIENKFGKDYLPAKAKQYKGKGRSQDAHEAIRPTDPELAPSDLENYLNKEQFALYRLIWQRFIASQMAPAKFDGLTVDIAGGIYLFRAVGSRLTFPGFLAVLNTKTEDNILPEIEKDEKLKLEKLKKEQHFTKPPARYSEGSLVKTLEEKGIGRPSTYAPTVATIQQRGYVLLEEGKFKATELGFTVNDLLVEYFPEITEIAFTASIEDELDQVEEGNVDWLVPLDQFYDKFSQRLNEAQKNMKEIEIVEEKTGILCPKCGAEMVVKYGRFGKFLACPSYPDCKHTQSVTLLDDIDCYMCNEGKIVERRSKKGRTFYGCSNYPNCEFSTWQRPIKEKCPDCGAFLTEKKTKKMIVKTCSREGCSYKEEKAISEGKD